MHTFKFILLAIVFITRSTVAQPLAAPTLATAELTTSKVVANYKSPLTFTEEVNNILQREQQVNIPPNGVVITGSSSVRFWQSIHNDFTDIEVISRGFGGSNMNDLLYFSEQLITQYQPRAVAIYEGDNDIAQGIAPQQVVSKFIELKNKIRLSSPEIRIYFIAIKPSLARQQMWPKMAETNKLMQALCQRMQDCTYLDVASNLLSNGLPKQDIFIADGLHLNKKGYQLWSQAIVPIIEKAEKMAEPVAASHK